MRVILGVILLALLGALGVFAVQNTQPLTVRFLNWGVTAPVALLTVAVYVLGMLSGWSVLAFLRHTISRVSSEPRSR